MLTTLTDWYLHADRIGRGIVVPEDELKDVMREAAKLEGQRGPFPWESMAEYELRIGAHKE